MPFITLNNLTIPVENQSANRLREEGANGRRWAGQWRRQRAWAKRRWEVETPWLIEREADALEHWVMGRGDHWTFDFDMYSEITGRGPDFLNAVGLSGGPVPKYTDPVTSVLLIGLATPGRAWQSSIPVMYDTSYTVSRWMWINQASYNLWRHYVQTFDHVTGLTQHWLDGVLIAPGLITNYSITNTGGFITLLQLARNITNTANIALYMEDLVMCPYVWTDAMISAVRTSVDAFGLSPRLRMRGDLLDEPGPVHVRAEMREVSTSQGTRTPSATTWQNNLRKLAFTLHEV